MRGESVSAAWGLNYMSLVLTKTVTTVLTDMFSPPLWLIKNWRSSLDKKKKNLKRTRRQPFWVWNIVNCQNCLWWHNGLVFMDMDPETSMHARELWFYHASQYGRSLLGECASQQMQQYKHSHWVGTGTVQGSHQIFVTCSQIMPGPNSLTQ